MPFARLAGLSRFLKQLPVLTGLLAFALVTAGCVEKADWQAMQRQASTPAGDLYGTHTLGQVFVANHAGLSGVEVMVVDYGRESGRPAAPLGLLLCGDLECRQTITRTTIPAEQVAHNMSFRLECAPQQGSAGRTYTLLVSAPQAPSPARATLWAHASDLYPEGYLLRDGEQAAGDLYFVAYYTMSPMVVADRLLQQAWVGLPQLPALLCLLLAPGYLLARLLPRSGEDDPIALLGICLALSVAAVPVLLLVLSQFGALLSRPAVLAGSSLLGASALALLIRDLLVGRWRGARASAPLIVAVVGITGMALALRAIHALDLVGPLWVDAVHHTLVARLTVEQRAIPTSYLPYIEVAPATYHFGFQGMVAVLHLLSGIPLPAALLLLGQSMSGLAGLPLYALGRRWGKSPWAGLGAAVVPAVFSLMPAYYISWSRYTEPAGLLILPVAALLLDRLLRRQRWHWGLGLATTVTLAGIVVTHLRVAAFMAALAALLLLRAMPGRRYGVRAMAAPWVRALLVSLAAAGLIWPWLWPSVRHLWLPAAQQWPVMEENLSLHYILFGPGRDVALLALAGAASALLWRRQEVLLLLTWVGILPLMANPRLVGLQAGGPVDRLLGLHLGAVVDDTAVGIALYVPLSLAAALAGGGLTRLVRRIGWARRSWAWVGVFLLFGLSVWGACGLAGIVNPRTAILARADLEAMAWIEDHSAPDALFLIDSYQWLAGVYAGTDGGYWISPLTGRRTWPPPALYGLGSAEYVEEINRVAQAAMGSSGGEDLYSLLRQHGVTHIYLGRYGGPLTPEKLSGWPGFRPVYQRNGVWIFALEP